MDSYNYVPTPNYEHQDFAVYSRLSICVTEISSHVVSIHVDTPIMLYATDTCQTSTEAFIKINK